MFYKSRFVLGLIASTALTLSSAGLAEGKTDLARKAIAAAQAKIDAVNIVGAAGDAPRLHAQAVAALHLAEDELRHHAKDAAFHDATHASELADMALAASQRQRTDAQQAATTEAQRQAAEANARAATAQSDAAAAQAAAAAARSAPPVVIQTPVPAPTSTTITSQTEQNDAAASPRATKHRAVRHRGARHHPAGRKVRTTTTVTTR